MVSSAERDELRRLHAQTTQGRWYARATDDAVSMNARYVGLDEGPGFVHDGKWGMALRSEECEPYDRVVAITLLQEPRLVDRDEFDANTLFIARVHDALPALLDMLDELERNA